MGTEPLSGLRRRLLPGTRLATSAGVPRRAAYVLGGGQAAACCGHLNNPLATVRARAGRGGHLAQGVITPVTFLLKGVPPV